MAASPFDLSSNDLSQLTDEQLAELAADVAVEQYERALASADPAALLESGFKRGFAANGAAVDPWLVDGILVCPGLLEERSKSSGSHDCTFVSVKLPGSDTGQWVFEATDLLDDEVRHMPGSRRIQRSITLVVAMEGMEVDMVTSSKRGNQHKMKHVRSFKVTRGELVQVSQRKAVKAPSHG